MQYVSPTADQVELCKWDVSRPAETLHINWKVTDGHIMQPGEYSHNKTGSVLTHWGWDKMDAISDAIFECISLNENVWIMTKISLKFVPRGPINKIPLLVQIRAWRRPGDKPLTEQMLVSLPIYWHSSLGLNELTHWGWDKMAAVMHTTSQIYFLSENCFTVIQVPLNFVTNGPIDNLA